MSGKRERARRTEREEKPPAAEEKPPAVAEEGIKQRGWMGIVLASAGVTATALYFLVGQPSAPPRPAKGIATSEATATATATSAATATATATGSGAAASASGTATATAMAEASGAAVADGPRPPPSPGETRVRAIWEARAQRRTGNALLGGVACTVEATLANVSGAIVPRGVTVRCGNDAIHNPDGIPDDATVTAAELPGLDRGSYVYTLQYRDGRAEIDTRHGRVEVDVRTPVPGTAYLIVANESRAVNQKLLLATPDDRVLQAGSRPSTDDDRAAGKVTAVSGDTLVQVGAKCGFAFHPYGTIDGIDRCDVLVQCGGVILIGRPELFSSHCKRKGTRVIAATDPEAQPADSDPGLVLDEKTARIWNDAAGARWSVLLALDPR